MSAPHLTLVDALALVMQGEVVPPAKYAALHRRGWVKVRGRGPNARPVLSETGVALLASRDEARG